MTLLSDPPRVLCWTFCGRGSLQLHWSCARENKNTNTLAPVALIPALLDPATQSPTKRIPAMLLPVASWHLEQLSSWLLRHRN